MTTRTREECVGVTVDWNENHLFRRTAKKKESEKGRVRKGESEKERETKKKDSKEKK